jgi:co-chaperonin GroES (HSP10)
MQQPEQEEIPIEQRGRQLPVPSGHKILCALVESNDMFEGSQIAKAEQTMKTEELTSPVLFVMKLGVSAYKDTERFPDGAWCKEGDFVITRPYTGTRIKIHDKEFRIINDDQVDGTVEDPRGISRV